MRRLALALVLLIAAFSICTSGCARKKGFSARMVSAHEEKDPSGKLVRKVTKWQSGSYVMTTSFEYRPATENDLGVPVYPGAKQDETFSIGTDSKGKTRASEQNYKGTRYSGIHKASEAGSLTVSVESRAGQPTKISVWRIEQTGGR